MGSKPFKTYRELIEKLRDKNMVIAQEDEEKVISLLKKYSYFSLVSGYKTLFKAADGNYFQGTTIDDIFALYRFDDELRDIFFRAIQIIEKSIKFLGSYGSVLLAMVYCMISFMILPCHSAVDKMDFTLVEASRDLGAKPWRAFLDVTLPLTLPGIMAGCVLVFVPSVGIFYLSDIMGGGLVLVGNLIRDQLLKVRDWHTGSAMSMLLVMLTAGIYLVYRKCGGDDLGVM